MALQLIAAVEDAVQKLWMFGEQVFVEALGDLADVLGDGVELALILLAPTAWPEPFDEEGLGDEEALADDEAEVVGDGLDDPVAEPDGVGVGVGVAV